MRDATFTLMLVALASAHVLGAGVVINEISYNPPGSLGTDEDFEFVEVLNTGPDSVDVGGWLLKDEGDDNAFELPAGTNLGPGAFLVIARNPTAIESRYGSGLAIAGGFEFGLGNGGGTVRLLDRLGAVADSVEYEDDPPWPPEADAGGSTLERVDPSAPFDDFASFAASAPGPLPGTPGQSNSRRGTRATRFNVVINEIGYHPVRQPATDPLRHCESQEFVELFNRGEVPIDMGGWSFQQGISFVFPPGASLPPGGYIVLFKDETEFRTRYPTFAGTAMGPYEGALDDGGEAILLVDAAAAPADFVEYNDRIPWPINPDGVQGTLELVDPLSDNERGRSWEESADFQGTPGARNAATAAFEDSGRNAAPDITLVEARPAADPGRRNLLSSDEVQVTARIADREGVAGAAVEYQTLAAGAYLRKTDPEFLTAWTSVPMTYNRRAARFEATLPRQPHRTLVRYRVRATDGALDSTAPRAGDPEPNLAYFVCDGIPDYVASVQSEFGPAGHVHKGLGKLPVYFMIASGEDIQSAQYVIRDWTESTYHWLVTVVFYWIDPLDGHVESDVYDHVAMRLMGGVHRYHWPKRSWKWRFNHGNYFNGRFNDGTPYPRRRSHMNLDAEQHNDGRPRGESGVFETLAYRLFRDAGVTAGNTTFMQLRVVDDAEQADQYEGDFFGIFLDIERIDTTMMANLGLPTDEAASIYKVDNGFDKKHPDCTPAIADVTAFTQGYTSINTVEWYRANFDLAKYFSFRSVVEFAHHYDMGAKNYSYYRNTATQLWEIVPWDLDNTFGSDSGDSAEPFNSRVLPKFPVEFKSRMRYLHQTIYDQERMDRFIDAWRPLLREVADADMDRWNRGPDCPATVAGNRGNQCGFYAPFEQRMTALKTWIRTRRSAVQPTFNDASIPATPVNELPLEGSSPAMPITLSASAYSDPEGDLHAASHWLVIEEGDDWTQPLWEEVSSSALREITPARPPEPGPIFTLGRSYEFRVRYQDATGRWSWLSAPTRFTVGVNDPTAPTQPANLRALAVNARAVAIAWDPSLDPETGVSGYRVFRDGQLLGFLSGATSYTDRAPRPRRRQIYSVTALNAPGMESAPSSGLAVDVPAGNFGGWTSPQDGFDYFYDSALTQDAYSTDTLQPGCLDGTWMRSALTDNWSGSRPGQGPVPGGVEAVEIAGAGEDGGAASVLSLEDPGNPSGPGIPSTNNRRIFLVHRLSDANPFAAGAGLTLVTRFRVNPAPQDLPGPSGQEPFQFKGQVGVARYVSTSGLRRHFSLALNQDFLLLPGATLPVPMLELQSLWVTIARESEQDGKEIYRVRVFRNGSTEPAVDQALPLDVGGAESISPGGPVNYLELGLSDSTSAGAIQVDFVGFKLGVHAPVTARAPGDFLRGDADASGKLNITDALYVVRQLFQGGPAFACPDAADADDSGRVDVTDAIAGLRYLFQGGQALPAPFPVCGADPSVDQLAECAAVSCP